VEVLDPQGRNPKCRPAVILTPTEEITPDGEVILVAISGRTDVAPPEMQVELPWQAQGHTRTRLNKPAVAVCTWLFKRPVATIKSFGGVVPARQMLEIIVKVSAVGPLEPPDMLPT